MTYTSYENALAQIITPYFNKIFDENLDEDELYELLAKLYDAAYLIGYTTGKSQIRDYIDKSIEMDLSSGDDEHIN